jgi:hypothetical protein
MSSVSSRAEMADIPITGGRGVQAVALAFAAVLGVSAYFFATTGWGTPFPGCWPDLARPAAVAVAVVQLVFAAGFVIAALRVRAVDDPLLIALVLALFAALAVGGGVHAFATGVARFGKSGCLDVGAPWSYAAGTFAILVGALAAYAAAAVGLRRESD